MPYPILLCTFTNVAVDNLVEGILASSLRPLRVGSSGKIKSSLASYVVENQLAAHRLTPELERVKTKLEGTSKRKHSLEQSIAELKLRELSKNLTIRLQNMEVDFLSLERQEKAYRAKAYAIHLEMLRDVVLSADVVSEIHTPRSLLCSCW